MARPTSAVFPLAAVVLVSIVVSVAGDARFIFSTCKLTKNPNCVKTLATDPRSTKATTVRELADVALDIAAAAVKDGSASINDKHQRYAKAEPLGTLLLGCTWIYDRAAPEVAAASIAFRSGGYRDAVMHQMAAHYAGVMCDELITRNSKVSVVADDNKKTIERSDVAVDLIQLLY
uniref:Pectinesterase inhibitor domain-containing protein n=1 Tax=Leersia perrieri TaxID=77586 RepID=A0A0D9XAD1_9ORYZ